MWDSILTYLPLDQFLDPNKRIYWPYLAISAIYAIIFLMFSKTTRGNQKINYWFNSSTLNDLIIWIVNHIIQLTLFPLLFLNSLSIASTINHLLFNAFGELNFVSTQNNMGIVFYSLVYFLLSDLSRYGIHYMMHHNTFLWRIHRMHHTSSSLTPITFFRVHPFEMLIFHLRFLLVHGFVTGAFIYLYNDVFDFPTIFGATFFVFLTNVLGGNLRHSNIAIGFGIMENLIISPKQHQMHHSKLIKFQQSNYGSFFSIWDKLFSTWKKSKGVRITEFGIKEQPKQSLLKDLLYPILGEKISRKFKL